MIHIYSEKKRNKNAELFNVKEGGTYSNHRALKG
jgi:hypothetical protein